MDILQQMQDMAEELVAMRRHLHQYPEASMQEFETSAYVKKQLDAMGVEWVAAGPTGVVGIVKGSQPGPVVGLRGDMDALEMDEQNEVPYRSCRPGCMHACGHDAHTAALLGAAKWFSQHRDILRGTVKLVFQPGEENGRGAASVVQSGAVDDLDAILGLHVDSSMPTGVIKMKSGPMSAANDKFKIWIEGVGCHGSTPEKGADAMLAMVSLAQSLQTVITRERSPLSPCVMTLGILQSGTAFNILPSEAYLEGSIRVLDEALREKNRESVRRMAECTAAAYRCTARCEFEATAYLVSNDKHLTELAWDAARTLAGEENLRVQEDSMGAEDFGAFMQVAPVTYLHVGTGNAELGTNFPHHHGRFDVDESALPLCAALYVQFACNVMQDAANQSKQ